MGRVASFIFYYCSYCYYRSYYYDDDDCYWYYFDYGSASTATTSRLDRVGKPAIAAVLVAAARPLPCPGWAAPDSGNHFPLYTSFVQRYDNIKHELK